MTRYTPNTFHSKQGLVVLSRLTGYDNSPKCVEIFAFYIGKVIISTAMNNGKVYVRFSPKAEPPLLEVEVERE